MSRTKNSKYESMSLEELKANMEKSRKQLEHVMAWTIPLSQDWWKQVQI